MHVCVRICSACSIQKDSGCAGHVTSMVVR
jgi:hypothetical protein